MVVNDHNNPSVGGLQRRRLLLVLVCAGLWTGLLVGRLVHLQVVLHDDLVEIARQQQEHEVTIPAMRGSILARDGSLLASSIEETAIYVHRRRRTRSRIRAGRGGSSRRSSRSRRAGLSGPRVRSLRTRRIRSRRPSARPYRAVGGYRQPSPGVIHSN